MINLKQSDFFSTLDPQTRLLIINKINKIK